MLTKIDTGEIINALTVDVEDYFHVSAFANQVSPDAWKDFESRVVRSSRRLLNILEQRQVHATFFFLGWVVERHPDLVREVVDRGHEIGWHTYWHKLVYDMTPEEFREDLRICRSLLDPIVGKPVVSFRAPSFSITLRSTWALDVLHSEGFEVDSSIFPVYHDRYGIPDADREPHFVQTGEGQITEFPLSVSRLGGMNIPASGGGYFRLYPQWLTRWLLTRVNRAGAPFVFYMHPWEIDPGQPKLKGSFLSRTRHYLNLRRTEDRLERLLQQFRFGTLSESLAAYADRFPESQWKSVRVDARHEPPAPRVHLRMSSPNQSPLTTS